MDRTKKRQSEVAVFAESLTVGEACIVRLTVTTVEGSDEFYGWAKKHPKDAPDDRIGQTVALSRAFETAAAHFQELSAYLVEENCGETNLWKAAAIWEGFLDNRLPDFGALA